MVMTSAYFLIKWCILNVPFCSIFVPFQFYLVMILVADNTLHFLDFQTDLKWCNETYFLDSSSLKEEGGGGVHAWVGVGKVHNMCEIHIVQYQKN